MVELRDVMAGDYDPDYRREGDLHIYAFEALKYELRFSRLSVSADAVHAWLDIRSTFPGDHQRLLAGQVNLSGPRARSDLAKQLEDRTIQAAADWKRILEVAFIDLIERLSEGSPVVKANEIQPRQASRFRIEPIAFDGLPVIWFGKGGSGKSLTALTAAISMQADIGLLPLPLTPGPVLYCDWELDAETWGEEVRLLCAGIGLDIPPIHYRACLTPLYHEADAIGRYIDREGIEVVIIDSLGAACGADKNSQEVATRMMTGIRSWGATAICIDHIAKADDASTPYGSTYFETSARATWRFKGAVQENTHFVSVNLEKSNLGRYKPVHLKFDFVPDMTTPTAIYCELASARDIPSELRSEGTRNAMKITTALLEAGESLTVADLIAATGLPEKSLRARLSELVRREEVTTIIIRGGANRYALRSHRDEQEMA